MTQSYSIFINKIYSTYYCVCEQVISDLLISAKNKLLLDNWLLIDWVITAKKDKYKNYSFYSHFIRSKNW